MLVWDRETGAPDDPEFVSRVSDHSPIWVELEVDYSDAYLARFLDD